MFPLFAASTNFRTVSAFFPTPSPPPSGDGLRVFFTALPVSADPGSEGPTRRPRSLDGGGRQVQLLDPSAPPRGCQPRASETQHDATPPSVFASREVVPLSRTIGTPAVSGRANTKRRGTLEVEVPLFIDNEPWKRLT